METDIKKRDTVACKLKPALKKAINQKLEVVKKKKRKREKIIKMQKRKAIAKKRSRVRKEIS